MQQTEILIIGQGIAGSLTAFMLHQQGVDFKVMDAGYENAASRVAAGMFTPISGKRKTLNAEMIQQIPFAIEVYKQIEKLLGKKILHLQNVYYVPDTIEEKQDLSLKTTNANFSQYVLSNQASIQAIKQELGAFQITNSGWLDCALFTSSFKDWLKQKDALIEEAFDYIAVKITRDKIQYKDIECKRLIFCEGYHAADNPFIQEGTIIPCKGDMLTIEYKNCTEDFIIKKNAAYLISLGNNKYKGGSTYKWHNNDKTLYQPDKDEIVNKLNAMLENEYSIVLHQSAIRPTTKNRQVVAIQHSSYPNLFILNGLGTKGVIQGPYYAKQIIELMLNGL